MVLFVIVRPKRLLRIKQDFAGKGIVISLQHYYATICMLQPWIMKDCTSLGGEDSKGIS